MTGRENFWIHELCNCPFTVIDPYTNHTNKAFHWTRFQNPDSRSCRSFLGFFWGDVFIHMNTPSCQDLVSLQSTSPFSSNWECSHSENKSFQLKNGVQDCISIDMIASGSKLRWHNNHNLGILSHLRACLSIPVHCRQWKRVLKKQRGKKKKTRNVVKLCLCWQSHGLHSLWALVYWVCVAQLW